MRNIKVSADVWQEIATRGKFGETEDDVLRRVFELPQVSNIQQRKSMRQESSSLRPMYATQRLSSNIIDNKLQLIFQGGNSNAWDLPDKSDKMAIRDVREEAVLFATDNGATSGQVNAVKKTLTEAGYYIIK